MNENTELTVNIPAPTEPSLVTEAAAFEPDVAPKTEQIQDEFAPEAPALEAKEKTAETNEPEKNSEEKETDHTAEDDKKIEELEAELEKLNEVAGGTEMAEQTVNANDQVVKDEELDPLEKIELKVDFKALLIRTLLITLRAIWLLITNPNQRITGKDLGLPEEAPDDTSNEILSEKSGKKINSWEKVLQSMENVEGTITEVMGFALRANDENKPMKWSKRDRDKKQKGKLPKKPRFTPISKPRSGKRIA